MIEIKNLNFAYKAKQNVLHNISFNFNKTGLYYIVGESGSGKSTLLKLIGKQLDNYQGNIKVKEKELSLLSNKEKEEYLRKTVSICLQQDIFDYKLSVYDNLMLSLSIFHMRNYIKREKINYYAKLLKVKNLLHKKLNKLSGGELKRMNLLRALIKDTPIILLDEPLGPLDEDLRNYLTDFFEELAKTKLVIIITHNVYDIKNYTAIITLKDGKIENLKQGEIKQETNINVKYSEYKRKRISFLENLFLAFKCLIAKGRYFSFTMFSTTIALTSIGLVLILTNSISLSLDNMLDTSFTNNTLLIKSNETKIDSPYYQAPNETYINSVSNEFNDLVIGYTYYYQINYENIFVNCNRSYIDVNGKSFKMNGISARSFGEFTYYKEIEDLKIYYLDLEYDEIILGLSIDKIYAITSSLNIEKTIDSLNSYLSSNELVLYLELSCAAWSYNYEMPYVIKKIVQTNVDRVIHTKNDFSYNFIEKQLQFSSYDDLSYDVDKPWCFFRSYVLMIRQGKLGNFLKEIEKQSYYNDLIFKRCSKEEYLTYYNEEDLFSLNRLVVYYDYYKTIEVSNIEKIIEKYKANIDSVNYVDKVYYTSDEGLVSGFLKPIYISNKKDLLNKLIDYNYNTEFDLEGFQGSTIKFDEGVIMGDISGTYENSVYFKGYVNKPVLKYGKIPKESNEILISSNLAKTLFSLERNCLDKTLYLTMLDNIEYENNSYVNQFKNGELIIKGIVESEDNIIYQEPRFINIFCIEQLNLDIDTYQIEKVIINFKQDIKLENVLTNLKDEFPNYSFSLPCQGLKESISEIVNYIGLFLYAFAGFSGIISFVLLNMIILLFIKEDSKKIEMLSIIGYSKKDISSYYLTICMIMGFLSFVSSTICLFFSSIMLSKQLSDLLPNGANIFNFDILLINLIIYLIIIIFVKVMLFFKFRKNKLLN